MPSIIAYPTSAAQNGQLYKFSNWINFTKDDNTYATVVCQKTDSRACIYCNVFDCSMLPENAIIKGINFECKMSIGSTVTIKLVDVIRYLTGSNHATTAQSGNPSIALTCNGARESHRVNLPFPWTADMLRSGGLSFGIQFKGTTNLNSIFSDESKNTVKIYYIRAVIEYEIPNDIVVTFDSIFNFTKWKQHGVSTANGGNIFNVTDTGFTFTAGVNDNYTNNSYLFPVEPGKTYTFEYDKSGASSNEAFVFYHSNSSSSWSSFTNSTNTKFNFTVPNDMTFASIRVDVDNSGDTINYSNFRIYPSGYDYMSNSVVAAQRSCTKTWTIPTPIREGYTFTGWNTKLDGGGITYTNSNAFPTSDLVLYSQWRANKINKIYRGGVNSGVYLASAEVSSVHAGGTKIYG